MLSNCFFIDSNSLFGIRSAGLQAIGSSSPIAIDLRSRQTSEGVAPYSPLRTDAVSLVIVEYLESIKKQFNTVVKEELLQIQDTDENILTYALFPEVGTAFFKNRGNSDYFEKEPLDFIKTQSEVYKVSIDGKDYNVEYSKNSDPIILNHADSNKTMESIEDKGLSRKDGLPINAPLGGNIFN